MKGSLHYKWLVAMLSLVTLFFISCGSGGGGGGGDSPDSPFAYAGENQSVLTGVTVTLDGSGSYDPNGKGLSYNWVFVDMPAGSAVVLSVQTSVNPTFVPDFGGRYIVGLYVYNGVAERYDTVSIFASSAAPVADAGPDQGVAAGSPVVLNGSGTADVDGNTITYGWSFISVPTGSNAVLSNTLSVYPSFTADLVGSYEIELVADDGISGSTTDTVTVNSSNAPTAEAGPDQGVATNSIVTLDGGASSDPDGDTIIYSWNIVQTPYGVPHSLSDPLAKQPTFTPTWDGDYVIALTVNDGVLDSTVDTVTISASLSPVANAGPDKSYTYGGTVTLDGSKSYDPDDPLVPDDGVIATYNWSFYSIPGTSSLTNADISGAATSTASFTPDATGPYELHLVVNDGLSDSDPDPVTITVLTPSGAPLAPVPDTGQVLCYDESGNQIGCAGTGQDGDYIIHPMSYTINLDGTRTDNVTGLMWQKCTNGQSGTICADTPATWYNGYEASGIYEATYNPGTTDVCGDLVLGGHSDWRLPEAIELMQIVNYGNLYPAISPVYFPNTMPYTYWSSTCIWPPTCYTSYYVQFGYGQVQYGYGGNMVDDAFVRCVRGPSAVPYLADNGDGTVLDINTGLEWQQLDDGVTRTWQQALDYCNGLSLSGNGWRLPNIKEIASSVRAEVYLPYNGLYWSSTNYSTSGWYAGLAFGSAFVSAGDKIDNLLLTRCVR